MSQESFFSLRNKKTGLMAEGCEPRVSVVWRLAEAVRHIKCCLQETDSLVNVYGVLLTEADILNAYELYKLWDEHDVTVIDCPLRLYGDIFHEQDVQRPRM